MSSGLFIWAVLNGMFDMASYLMNLDNQECAKALIAAELCTQISKAKVKSEYISNSQRKKFEIYAE